MDMLSVIQEVRCFEKVLGSFNSTFIALIPKYVNPTSYDDYIPISLCNCVYKIIIKVLAIRLKDGFSKVISLDQFGFFVGRQIHETINASQEGIYN